MICAFSYNPPPRAVSGVTGQKLLKNLFKNRLKCMDFNFVPEGGGGGEEGGNLDKAVFTTGNGRSLANSLAKGGGNLKGRVSNPFSEDCVEIRLKKLDLS